MLAGLDAIDWTALGYHVYRGQETIPQEVRNLLSPNAQVREEARGFLLGGGQDYGDICDTTPHIIPFLLELLASEATPDRAALLEHLAAVAGHTHDAGRSIYEMRLCLRTYDALRAGLDLLSALLASADREIRLASAGLLQYLADDVEHLAHKFCERFRAEQDEEVQVALLAGLKTLFASLDWRRDGLKEQYAPFFRQVVEGDHAHKVRVAAARASAEVVRRWRDDRVSPQVAGLLCQEFLELSGPAGDGKGDVYLGNAHTIIMDLAELGAEPLLSLLRTPGLSAGQAHWIARGLLVDAIISPFGDRRARHWTRHPDYRLRHQGFFYCGEKRVVVREKGLVFHERILRAIVDADAVWQLPSNLFSFFYGLPDSREALRELLG